MISLVKKKKDFIGRLHWFPTATDCTTEPESESGPYKPQQMQLVSLGKQFTLENGCTSEFKLRQGMLITFGLQVACETNSEQEKPAEDDGCAEPFGAGRQHNTFPLDIWTTMGQS